MTDVHALLFVDVVDARSYIGAVRFERAAALFSIVTGRPVNVSYRATRAATDPHEYAAAARVTGIDLNLDDIVPAEGLDAWRLLTWAAATGDQAQRDLLHQLWRTHFLEGADIDDRFVLASRAALAGLDLSLAEEVLAEEDYLGEVVQQRELAESLGARETPFIVIDAHHTLAGLHSQDGYFRALQDISAGGEGTLETEV